MDYHSPYEVRPPVFADKEAARHDPELLRSLACMVRGLSALFWGLPMALVICVQSASGTWLRSLGILPALLATGLLFFGLYQIGYFQRRERVWQRSLDRAKIVALLVCGLSPFLFWWRQVPGNTFFLSMVLLMALGGLMFLFLLNPLLCRLSAMLPDETLREETRAFTNLNRLLLLAIPLALCGLHFLSRLEMVPGPLSPLQLLRERFGLWVGMFLVLMPMAMTMALIWKIKEVILASVFSPDR